MKIKVKFIGFQKKEEVLEVEDGVRYSELLKKLNINPETVVIVKDGLPVPIDDVVESGDIAIVRVISGG